MEEKEENEESEIMDTMSINSDETQIITLNEQLLCIIQFDNNTELIRWIIQNHKYKLFECIDQRLMISLIYRITQLIKNNTFINDICSFLKKEFILNGDESIKIEIPRQLKEEFLKAINQHPSMQQFVSRIANAIQ